MIRAHKHNQMYFLHHMQTPRTSKISPIRMQRVHTVMAHLNGLTKFRKLLFGQKFFFFMNSLKRSLWLWTCWSHTARNTLLAQKIGSAQKKLCQNHEIYWKTFLRRKKIFGQKNPKFFFDPKSSQNHHNKLRNHCDAGLNHFWHSDELISECCTMSYFEQYPNAHLTQKSKFFSIFDGNFFLKKIHYFLWY